MDFFKSFNVIFQLSFANLRIFSILQMFLKSVSRIPLLIIIRKRKTFLAFW